jgi:hypothetical protein
LPQFGANFKLDKNSEIFGDAAYNVRAYVPGVYGYSTSTWGTLRGAPGPVFGTWEIANSQNSGPS